MHRRVLLAVFASALACAVFTPPARAAGDDETIQQIRQIFSVDTTQASNEDLKRLLGAKDLGDAIRAQVACAYLGQHALDDTRDSGANVAAFSEGIGAWAAATRSALKILQLGL